MPPVWDPAPDLALDRAWGGGCDGRGLLAEGEGGEDVYSSEDNEKCASGILVRLVPESGT